MGSIRHLDGFVWVTSFLQVQCWIMQTTRKYQLITRVRPFFDVPRLGCQGRWHQGSGIFSLPLLSSVKRQLFCQKNKFLKIDYFTIFSSPTPKLAKGWGLLGKDGSFQQEQMVTSSTSIKVSVGPSQELLRERQFLGTWVSTFSWAWSQQGCLPGSLLAPRGTQKGEQSKHAYLWYSVLVLLITMEICNVFWSAHNYMEHHPLYI